jgi:hypothetical protein
MSLFLTQEELVILTGRKKKNLQLEQLRKMGVPFFVNALNAPVVARVAIEGRPTKAEPPPKAPWVPNVLRTS